MKALLICTLLFVGCYKSREINTPIINHDAKAILENAMLRDSAGATVLVVRLNLKNSAEVDKCNLVIYQTDVFGTVYRYALAIKDGEQVIICDKYATKSPMTYQLEYVRKNGSYYISDLYTQTFS